MHATINPQTTVVKYAQADLGTVSHPMNSYAMAQIRDSAGDLYEFVGITGLYGGTATILSGGGGGITIYDLEALGIDTASANALVSSWQTFPSGEQCGGGNFAKRKPTSSHQ